MRKLIDLYKALDVKNVKTELAIAPFDFKAQADDNGVPCKVTGADGVVYERMNVQAAFYTAVCADGNKYKVFAFIGKPETPAPEGGYPAIVLAHGGGGCAYFEWVQHWVDKGYVAIAPDLRSQYAVSVEKRALANDNGAPYGIELDAMGSFQGTDRGEKSWMYYAPFALGFALNALKEYAPINEEKVALAGISWGGVACLHTAAVEPRFKAVSIIYSSAYHWDSEWAMDKHNVKDLTEEQLALYKEYFDPANTLDHIQSPILFTAGMDDAAFSTVNRTHTTEKVNADKRYAYFVSFPHGHWEGWTPKQSYAFTDEILGFRKPFAKIELTISGKEAKIKVSDKVEEVYLAYTTEVITAEKNVVWEETAAKKACRVYKATLPENATACFARYGDSDGVSFSTDVYYL